MDEAGENNQRDSALASDDTHSYVKAANLHNSSETVTLIHGDDMDINEKRLGDTNRMKQLSDLGNKVVTLSKTAEFLNNEDEVLVSLPEEVDGARQNSVNTTIDESTELSFNHDSSTVVSSPSAENDFEIPGRIVAHAGIGMTHSKGQKAALCETAGFHDQDVTMSSHDGKIGEVSQTSLIQDATSLKSHTSGLQDDLVTDVPQASQTSELIPDTTLHTLNPKEHEIEELLLPENSTDLYDVKDPTILNADETGIAHLTGDTNPSCEVDIKPDISEISFDVHEESLASSAMDIATGIVNGEMHDQAGSLKADHCTDSVVVKSEPIDPEYENQAFKLHRNRVLVVYTDSESEMDNNEPSLPSTDENLSDDDNDSGHDDSDENIVERLNARKFVLSKNRSRTAGEIFPEELEPIEYLTISPGEDVVLEPLGTVSGIVDVLVVVKSNLNSPALFDDTVLFLDGRRPLGLIFETFGTVEQAYYSVRFNSNKDIKDRDIAVGSKVFFAPKADNITKYIFLAELQKIKGDDASWENDNEPPETHLDYSDDEQERRARVIQRSRKMGTDGNSEAISDHRRKRRRRPQQETRKDARGPKLLPGDLNRNPFGNTGQRFHSSPANWPVQGSGPASCGLAANNNYDWKFQPGLLGDVPFCPPVSAQSSFSHFGTGSMFVNQQRPPTPQFGGSPFPIPPAPPCPTSYSSPFASPFTTSPVNLSNGAPFFPSSFQQSPASIPLPPTPPPSTFQQCQNHPGYPLFSPSQPPPVVSSVFSTIPPPPAFTTPPPASLFSTPPPHSCQPPVNNVSSVFTPPPPPPPPPPPSTSL